MTNHHQTDILLEAGTNELEIIEFSVGEQRFGVNVAKVKQVVRWQPDMLTSIADAPYSIMGVIYYRGKPVTLVNLREALKIEAAPAVSDRLLILVTQFNDVFTSFLIDRVNRIHRVSWQQLEPWREIIPGVTSYVTGSITIEDRVVMILDLEHMMSLLTPHLGIMASKGAIEKIAANHNRANVTIFFAEDSVLIRKMTTEQLKKAGFQNIVVFENGQRAYDKMIAIDTEAKAQGQTLRDHIHLLLTDIEMPQMDGLTLCRKVKEEMGYKDLPVVMYSSLINEQMSTKCRAVGSDAHISKPKIDQIVGILDRLCGINLESS
jgi:two-component system, chemotaxis family, chemotaxis protein CheV